jgi:hypothetical protein
MIEPEHEVVRFVAAGLLGGFFGGSIASRLTSAMRAGRSTLRIVFVRSRPIAGSGTEPTGLRVPMCAPPRGVLRGPIIALISSPLALARASAPQSGHDHDISFFITRRPLSAEHPPNVGRRERQERPEDARPRKPPV